MAGPLPPPGFVPPPGFIVEAPPSAVTVNVMNPDFVWDQTVDVVDDYFRVQREERVRLVGDMYTEGLLVTYPRVGSTLLEPWNRDSVNFYERLESTLQSIRRTALVRVRPAMSGFEVEVEVRKELEDVPRPETGSVSQLNSLALRNDNSMTRVANPVTGQQPTIGWIDKGRDLALEQTILADIQSRLGGYPNPGSVQQF